MEAEAGVLALPHRPHVADPGRGDQQPHARVAHPERRQLPQLLGQLEAEADAADHRVDPLGPPQVLGPEHRGRVGGERLAEGVEVLGPQLRARRRPGGRRSPPGAPSRPRAPPAGRSRGCCGPSRALRPRRRARSTTDRPVVALDQPRGDDPDHAGVPALAGEHQRRAPRAARSGSSRRAASAAASTSRSVARRSRLARLSSLGDLLGPRLVLGQEQLDPGVGAVEPPGGVDPRRQPEGEVALVEPASARISPPPAAPACPAAAPAASPPGRACTSDRFSPTSGTTSATVASATRSRSASARRPRLRGLPQRARQLPGDRRAAERARTGSRSIAGCRIGQSGSSLAGLVVVGDDRPPCPARAPAPPPRPR